MGSLRAKRFPVQSASVGRGGCRPLETQIQAQRQNRAAGISDTEMIPEMGSIQEKLRGITRAEAESRGNQEEGQRPAEPQQQSLLRFLCLFTGKLPPRHYSGRTLIASRHLALPPEEVKNVTNPSSVKK